MLVDEPIGVPPHYRPFDLVDDEHGVQVAGADQNIAGPEAHVSIVEPTVGRQLTNRIDVRRIAIAEIPVGESIAVVNRPPFPHQSALAVHLPKVVALVAVSRGEHQCVAVLELDHVVMREITFVGERHHQHQFARPVVLLDLIVGADDEEPAVTTQTRSTGHPDARPRMHLAPVHVSDRRYSSLVKDQVQAPGSLFRLAPLHSVGLLRRKNRHLFRRQNCRRRLSAGLLRRPVGSHQREQQQQRNRRTTKQRRPPAGQGLRDLARR